MSVMTRPKKTQKTHKTAAPVALMPRMTREIEAPDRGVSHEAPDAGEGRAALPDQEFTHGRSQS